MEFRYHIKIGHHHHHHHIFNGVVPNVDPLLSHISRSHFKVNLMYIGPCIIVIIEEKETNLMSQFIKFYFTSTMLNMFRTLSIFKIK